MKCSTENGLVLVKSMWTHVSGKGHHLTNCVVYLTYHKYVVNIQRKSFSVNHTTCLYHKQMTTFYIYSSWISNTWNRLTFLVNHWLQVPFCLLPIFMTHWSALFIRTAMDYCNFFGLNILGFIILALNILGLSSLGLNDSTPWNFFLIQSKVFRLTFSLQA